MKKRQLKGVLGFVLAATFVWAWGAALRAQSQFTAAQLANLQKLEPSAVPRAGTFYLASDLLAGAAGGPGSSALALPAVEWLAGHIRAGRGYGDLHCG